MTQIQQYALAGVVVVLVIAVAFVFYPWKGPLCRTEHQALFTAPGPKTGTFDKDGKEIENPPLKLVITICDDKDEK